MKLRILSQIKRIGFGVVLLSLLLTAEAAFSASDLREALTEYPVIVYVNKSVGAKWSQKILVFVEGRQAIVDQVSTGREQFEEEWFSGTPKGFFIPQYLVEDHIASQSGISMPYSIFFYKNIALHQAIKENNGVSQLGRRASAGCVRLSPGLAPRIFTLVSQFGKGRVPVISQDGLVAISDDGDFIRRHQYMTLIIVDDSKSENPAVLSEIREAFQ